MGSVSLFEAFAARRFGGNLAGVVVTADTLDAEVMQGTASDLLAPTTGFVTKAATTSRSSHVRFFTPTQEIAACGHVAAAVAAELVGRGAWSAGEHDLTCGGGRFTIRCEADEVSMRQTRQVEAAPRSTLAEIEAYVGQAPTAATVAGTGLRHLFVEFAEVQQLGAVTLDAEVMAQLGRRNGVDTIGLFAPVRPGVVRLRDITAPIGVLEEPASGTTSGALGLLLDEGPLVVEQGVEMGRPSQLTVRPQGDDVEVAGTVRRVFTGVLDE